MPNPTKPWKSFEEQLALLKSRRLHVEDEQTALHYLSSLGYYRLSGYWYPLRKIDKAASVQQGKPVRLDEFVEGSRFEDVVRLYVFDKKLRLLALDALERIEMAVRVDVAYTLGKRDPLAHEKPRCLHGNFTKNKPNQNGSKTEHELWLEKYQTLLHRARREAFVAHHRQNYDGQIPIWAAIELWDFGLLSKLFSGMKVADKDLIAEKYGAKDGRALAQWLHSLNFIRNISAHHARLWNANMPKATPNAPSGWPSEIKPNRPFFYFYLMHHMLKALNPKTCWRMKLARTLVEDFPELPNETAALEDFGIIGDWEERIVGIKEGRYVPCL